MSATERLAVLYHRCPECRAPRGEHCVTATVKQSPRRHPHKVRVNPVLVTR